MWNYSDIVRPKQSAMVNGRVLVWFSCGIASAVAAKFAVEKYKSESVEILYCDTLKYEHPDNIRFMGDVENWIGKKIKILDPVDYTGYKDIFDVFDRTGWLVGPAGARCSTELKKRVRQMYQDVGDLHIFGLTLDEEKRIAIFEKNNIEIYIDWILRDNKVTKEDCKAIVADAGIEIPVMYKMGYKNNNCIGCVKGGMGYWNKVRKDFPDHYNRMAAQERKMGVSVNRKYFLDELPETAGRYEAEPDIECGPQCGLSQKPGE